MLFMAMIGVSYLGILAEIHGKVSSSGTNINERLEDLLTSNIFQLLRYLPFEFFLKPIIQQSTNIDGEMFKFDDDVSEAKLMFWKSFKKSEPDIYIQFVDDKGNIRLHIFIEAKYHSPKSGSAQFDEDNNYVNDSDQLQREWADLEEQRGSRPGALIFLTQDRSLPVDAIKESIGVIGSEAEDRLFWLNWQSIHRIMESNHSLPQIKEQRLIISDIISLLRHKGLFDFEGWHIESTYLNPFQYFSRELFIGYPVIDIKPFSFFKRDFFIDYPDLDLKPYHYFKGA